VRRGENPLILSGEELLNETAIRELSAIYRSDLAIMVSRYEIELLRDRYGVPERLLALNGFRYPAPSVAVPSYGDRRDIAAIGNFNHPPNHDSFRILHEEIWPRIRRRLDERGLRGVELHIYGAYPTRDLMARDNAQTGFRVRGPAVDAIETLSRYRLNVAPLRFGAGIKGKVADGWAAGTPCIATSIAAEGMKSGEAFGGVIADSWEEFAQAACELYESPESWTDAQQTGWKVLRDEFDSDANATSFLATLAEVVAQRDARRATNPVGHMLWHHRCRSVEYFSRWIEAKNRAR
jgi:glycosyltransferase involved in cell wall biosynthesis